MAVDLEPARVRSAMARARIELSSARLAEKAARAARAKADTLAEIWGFDIDGDEVVERDIDQPGWID